VNTKPLIVSVFALATFAVPQEIAHAPALQSCTADLNLWTSQIPGWPIPTPEQGQEGTKSLTVHEITNRISYLSDCAQAYPVLNKNRTGELSALSSLTLVYESEIQMRLFHFLGRHGLADKFTEEDETGKR
jgi:hypothetical protein